MSENEFEYKGKTYVEVSAIGCRGCAFDNPGTISASADCRAVLAEHPCTAQHRRDNRSVKYVEKLKPEAEAWFAAGCWKLEAKEPMSRLSTKMVQYLYAGDTEASGVAEQHACHVPEGIWAWRDKPAVKTARREDQIWFDESPEPPLPEGWTANTTGKIPCAPGDKVEVVLRDGTPIRGRADSFDWRLDKSSCDIVRYRVVEEKQMYEDGPIPRGARGDTTRLPTDAAERKATPIATGVLDYFPLALAEVARLSKAGNDQHNPGQPLHWDKTKSTDHADCILRHLIERGTIDTDNQRHSAKVAWRALALLQIELESGQ